MDRSSWNGNSMNSCYLTQESLIFMLSNKLLPKIPLLIRFDNAHKMKHFDQFSFNREIDKILQNDDFPYRKDKNRLLGFNQTTTSHTTPIVYFTIFRRP